MTGPCPGADHRPPLGDHRLIGAGAGAALLLPDGEVDWWCPDRFEADPVLWRLLDADGGVSRWAGARPADDDGPPSPPAGSTMRTTVRCDGRVVDLWDGLVDLAGRQALVRLARARDVDATLCHEVRVIGFGTAGSPDVHVTGDGTAAAGAPGGTVDGTLRIDVAVTRSRWSGLALRAGRPLPPMSGDDLALALQRAELADERAMARIRLPDDHPDRANDALRVLRALTDIETGAPVAAPTTSLPEAVGGDRQFDYRYSWLRDSALAASVAAQLGHLGSAERYLEFVADLVERDGPLHPVSTSRGDAVPPERDVPGVSGWAGSRPVRVGNGAADQRQLDAVAAVIDAAWHLARRGGRFDRRAWATVDHLATKLAEAPFEPTSGIWEVREERLLVSEELARWRGLDRAMRLRRRHRPWVRRRSWAEARDAARARVDAVVDPATGMLPQTFEPGDRTPDAYALTVATTGFWPPDDPRTRRLVLATIDALTEGDGPFLRRYPATEDGFTGVEGAFVPASWWAVGALAAIGELDAARARADALCVALPPVLPEEWDVASGEGRGNTPLLWSHMEAAQALEQLESADGWAWWHLVRHRLPWRRSTEGRR